MPIRVTRPLADYYFVQTEIELRTLRRLHSVMEAEAALAVQHLDAYERDLEQLRARQPDAVSVHAVEHLHEARDLEPGARTTRSAFLLVLYSVFEYTVGTVAETLRKEWREEERAPTVSLLDYQAKGSDLQKARRYFAGELNLPLVTDEGDWLRMTRMAAVRRALAHAHGVREPMRDTLWNVLQEAARKDAGLRVEKGAVSPGAVYVSDSLDFVERILRDIIHRARLRLAAWGIV
jgi:hypothetical protein